MNVLIIGDVVGKIGVDMVKKVLPNKLFCSNKWKFRRYFFATWASPILKLLSFISVKKSNSLPNVVIIISGLSLYIKFDNFFLFLYNNCRMKINSLELNNFRNYAYAKTEFSDGLNFIVGANAQGKTNILESIYFLSTLIKFHIFNK
mgnify:CR=1 FL=1